MTWLCSQCHFQKGAYSHDQIRKGEGNARCVDCVAGIIPPTRPSCRVCDRSFRSSNELNMHMQVHRPRTVGCPVCGEERFRSAANAVQHVESGACSGCRGKENARAQIYRFASGTRQLQQYVTELPMLEYGGYVNSGVPDYPYKCPQCELAYRNLSQLMQHQDQRHGNQLRIDN